MTGGEVDHLVSAIARLGFSELEAACYHALLRAPSSTGYRVAKLLGKPHANVYQALTGLERKGAVVFEDEARRVYSAVPPSEVFDRLRRKFDADTNAVEKALAEVGVERREGERLFHLGTREQMFARARKMVEEAEECILCYAGPPEMDQLQEPLAAAVARGVCVTGVMVREEDLLPGSKLRLSRVAGEIRDRWGSLPVMLVVDARELLIAELLPDSDQLGDAIWTRNRLISALFHNGIVSDTILHGLPEVEGIRSPNTYLLGDVPTALKELFADRRRRHASE